MKKSSCLLLLSFLFLSVTEAQNTSQYKWGDRPPLVIECEPDGTHTNKKIPASPNSYFIVTGRLNADTVICRAGLWGEKKGDNFMISDPEKFRQFNLKTSAHDQFPVSKLTNNLSNSSRNQDGIKFDDVITLRQYFLVPVSVLGTADALPVYATWGKSSQFTLGVVNMPLKLRIHSFDFAKDLNIGTVVGVSMRSHKIKNNFVNFLFNISISVNDMDESTTRNVPADQLPAKNIAALTLAAGTVWQFGKGQIGLFYGFDFMSHNNWVKYRWVYNKRPWIGIGFGLTLFQKDNLSAGPGDEASNFKKN